MRLKDKVAIVTGASQGIGQVIATRLAEEGAKVVLAARTKANLEATAQKITDGGGTCLVLPTDITVESAVSQMVVDTLSAHGTIDILINNSGVAGEMGLLEDAISEFGKAEKDPSRYVDCQTLKGLCYSEKGDTGNAEVMFQQALDSQHLEDDQRLSLCYELASLYESSERHDEALSSYQLVMSQDESYRDISDKVKLLQEKSGDLSESSIEVKKDRISFL